MMCKASSCSWAPGPRIHPRLGRRRLRLELPLGVHAPPDRKCGTRPDRLVAGTRSSGPSALLTLCLACIALAVVAQLVPLTTSRLSALSPQAVGILGQQSLLFTLGESTSHPLSIDPSRTQLGLAFLGGFGLLLPGTARVLTRASANRLAGALVILGVALATVGIVQRATFTGKIYGFWELVQGGAPFGAHGIGPRIPAGASWLRRTHSSPRTAGDLGRYASDCARLLGHRGNAALFAVLAGLAVHDGRRM